MILPLLASLALADSITLDTGATIEGDLARYEFGGDCQISVTEGGLAGVIVIVPCHRVLTFQRTSARTPVPIGLEVEAQKVSAREEAPMGAVAAPAVEEIRGQSLVDAPLQEPDAPVHGALDEPFYDEPLFPADATTPIAHPAVAPVAEPAPRAAAPAPQSYVSPPVSTQAASAATYGVVPAPTAMETTGPRLAPRMDEAPATATPPAPSRSVSF